MLEKVSDQVLDIVLTEEETPLQQILIEQLVKITTANARMVWTEARLRSGVLSTGRTLLGTLVDPLVRGTHGRAIIPLDCFLLHAMNSLKH
jgi:hypothetical protein